MSALLFALPLITFAPQDAAPRFAWADLDLDRRPDAVSVTPEGRLSLLRNAADGSFQDLLPTLGLDLSTPVAFVLVEDFDRDGDADLFLGTPQGPSRLLRNEAGQGFDDVGAVLGLNHEGRDVEARWLDYDQDGRLDLQVIGEGYHRLYRAVEGLPFEVVELPPVHTDRTPDVFLLPAPAHAPEADGTDTVAGGSRDRTVLQGGSVSGRQPIDPTARLGGGGTPVGSTDTERLGSSSNCPLSIQDTSNPGSCLQAASTPTLGMLYPLSGDFFVSAISGFTGIGTTSPDRQLSVVRDVANEGLATFDNPDPAGFAGVYFEENSIGRGWVGHVNSGSFFGAAGTMQVGAQGTDIVFSADSSEFFVERMRIGADGDVGIGTDDPKGKLQVTGMIRQGSETGTTQSPDEAFVYTGMVTRRIISTVTTAGDVVARSRFLRLERDGTNGGMQLSWDAGSLPNQAAYGTALTNGGTVVPIVINIGAPASAGTMAVYAPSDVVRLDLAFGNVFNTREMTEVTLIRENGDLWWVGHLLSTWDQ